MGHLELGEPDLKPGWGQSNLLLARSGFMSLLAGWGPAGE